ncbi:MAG: hypothetical protein COA86_07200 [Kangiella sp.]|nr:MAG: hypothetical protein COA86_07200 [Kangiella sp.]
MKFLLAFIFVSSLIPISTQASYIDSSEPVDKPAQSLIKPLLNALNSGDDKLIREFVINHFNRDWTAQIDESVLYLNLIATTNGKLKLHYSRDYTKKLPDSEMVFIVYSALNESWRAITLITDEQDEDRISLLDLSPARWPSDLPSPATISESLAISKLSQFVQKMSDKDVFSGAILFALGNKVLMKQAFGEASKRYNVINQTDTKFNLASVGKMFTGVAIVQLIQSQKIKSGDKLSQYLGDNWLDKSISQNITVEQLLTHTSGLGNNAFGKNNFELLSKNTFRDLVDYQPLIKKEKLISEPGSQFNYSNTGIFLAGVVIEKVTGMSYFDYIQKNIFDVAGMDNSGFFDMDEPVSNVATGYERTQSNKTGWRNNWFEHFIKGSPAGGAVSTVEDMHKFAQALMANRLLDKAMTKKLMAYYNPYGNNFVGHTGMHFGINTEFVMFPQTEYIIVILSNYTTGASSVSGKLHQLIKQIESVKNNQ